MIVLALAAVVSLAGAPAPQSTGGPSAADLARTLQTHYESVRDFTADFVHSYEGGALRTKATERGHMSVKKPGKMRWTYTSPEEKVFVSDGKKLYAYVPADRQVRVSDLPPADEATTPVLFLTGRGDLTRDFVASYSERYARPGSYALELVPRRAEGEYDWLVLVVNRDTLKIERLVTGDRQGGTSTFDFHNLEENVGVPERAFAFSIPRGVDVITQ